MKRFKSIIFLLSFVAGIFSQEAVYLGDLSFDYSGSASGSFESGLELDSLDFIPEIPENGAFVTLFHDGTNMHTILSAMSPNNTDETKIDVFFLHLLTESTPEEGTYPISALDIGGFDEIPTTMLFIPEADTSFIFGLFDTFMGGISDSLGMDELLLSMVMELAQDAFIPLSGNIEINSITGEELTGGFNGSFMKLGFPPQFIDVENGSFNLIGTDTDFMPQAPVNVTGLYENQEITISWDAVSDSLVSGYNVYRSTMDDDFSWIGQTDYMTTLFTDNIIEMGNTYYYAVTSYYFDYIESDYSELIVVEIEELVMGDVNGDSLINVVDVITIMNFILNNTEPTSTEFYISDMNGDGQINVVDIISIVNVILGN